MASYASDEEQLEALKNWWKENGSSLLTGIAVVLVVFFGTRYWQDTQVAKAQAASEIYAGIMEQMAINQDEGFSEEALASLESSYNQLRNEFPDSIYVRYGALMLAGAYVRQQDFEQAATELNWVLDNQELGFMQSAEPELFLTARLRLARVRIAQDQPQVALDLLSTVDPGVLAAGFAEVQGDAYVQLGETELARAAYQRAINLAPANANFIDLKLRGLGN